MGIPVCSVCMCLCSHLSPCLARGGSLQAQPCLQPHHKETGPQVKHGFSGLCSLSHGPPCLLPSPYLITKHLEYILELSLPLPTSPSVPAPGASLLTALPWSPTRRPASHPSWSISWCPCSKITQGPPLGLMDQTHNVGQEVSLDTPAQGEDSLHFVCMPL